MAPLPSTVILRTSFIHPASPTPPHPLFLSCLDLYWRWMHHNQRVLFYPSCTLQQFPSFVASLKDGLSRALVHFFPWAGRIAQGDDGRHVVNCNDAGVEFVEASIDVPFSDLVEADFQFRPYFQKLMKWGDLRGGVRPDVPLLSVQVTRFLHGGVAVALSQNHMIADGHSLWHFMLSWAECTRGIPISKPPLTDRTILKLDNPSPEKASYPFLALGNPGAGGGAFPFQEMVTVDRVFRFSAEMVKKLKSMAGEDGANTFSSYESLMAHCWKCVTRARMLQPSKKLHFMMGVNGRRRMVPPLPDSYFGNVVQTAIALNTVGELLEETLGVTAGKIHEAISVCDDKHLRGMMHWLELRDNKFGFPFIDSVGMLVASSPRFPVYEVDFGWGKPNAVMPVRVGGEGEICLFAGREGGGSVDVCLKLEDKVMEQLEKDASFLLF